jgi:hypothetical protein
MGSRSRTNKKKGGNSQAINPWWEVDSSNSQIRGYFDNKGKQPTPVERFAHKNYMSVPGVSCNMGSL